MRLLIKNLLFTVLVPGTVAVSVPLLLARDSVIPSGLRLALAVAFLTGGGTIYAWCVWQFAAVGGGTPLPLDAPKKLIIRGLYQHTRNPMYLGVLLVVCGWAIFFASWPLVAYAGCVAGLFHLFIVLYEENRLRREFGRDYDEYCTKVGRWIPWGGPRSSD